MSRWLDAWHSLIGANGSRAVDNPNESFSEFLDALTFGSLTDAGVPVTPTTAFQATAIFAAIRVLSDAISSLPLKVYEKIPGGGRREAREHPVWRLLHESPHDLFTPSAFFSTQIIDAGLWGNSYAILKFGPDGRVESMRPFPAGDVQIIIQNNDEDDVFYRMHRASGTLVLRSRELIHVPWKSPGGGLMGASPATLFRQSIGLLLAAEAFGAKFFGSGAHMSMILEAEGPIDTPQAQAIKTAFEAASSGMGNAHKTVILQRGVKAKPWMIEPEKAQFLQTRKFQIAEVSRIYGVPPHMLSEMGEATFSNIDAQGLAFLTNTLLPWLTRWEQELNRKLFLERERGQFFVKFSVAGLLRADVAARGTYYQTMITNGIMTPNEVRGLEDLNAIEGGDELMIQGAMVSLKQAASGKPAPSKNDSQDRLVRSFAAMLDDARKAGRKDPERIKKKMGAVLDQFMLAVGIEGDDQRAALGSAYEGLDIDADSDRLLRRVIAEAKGT